MTFQDKIVRDAAICGGQPVVRGTRVPVRTILGYLAHGEGVSVILADFPSLTEDDVRAVVAFAAASASARGQGRVRVKLDENIPHTVRNRLAPLGLEVRGGRGAGAPKRRSGDPECFGIAGVLRWRPPCYTCISLHGGSANARDTSPTRS